MKLVIAYNKYNEPNQLVPTTEEDRILFAHCNPDGESTVFEHDKEALRMITILLKGHGHEVEIVRDEVNHGHTRTDPKGS